MNRQSGKPRIVYGVRSIFWGGEVVYRGGSSERSVKSGGGSHQGISSKTTLREWIKAEIVCRGY